MNNQVIKNGLRKALVEHFSSSRLISVPKRISIDESEKIKLKNIGVEHLILEPLNEESPVKIKVDVPWSSNISDAIDVYIILTNNNLFQIDINMDKSIQNLGLGYKIYLALILDFGHLYSGKGRRHNHREVPQIWDKLKKEPRLQCLNSEKGELCILRGAPNVDELMNNFKGI